MVIGIRQEKTFLCLIPIMGLHPRIDEGTVEGKGLIFGDGGVYNGVSTLLRCAHPEKCPCRLVAKNQAYIHVIGEMDIHSFPCLVASCHESWCRPIPNRLRMPSQMRRALARPLRGAHLHILPYSRRRCPVIPLDSPCRGMPQRCISCLRNSHGEHRYGVFLKPQSQHV